MKRKRFSERQVLATLICQGIVIRCFRCQVPFSAKMGDALPYVGTAQREHLHEFGLDGPDIPENCRYSCEPCHKIITNGTKATTAGSSKHIIAKAKRIAAGGRKRKGPQIKSRGFDKKLRRKMNGTVEKRA